MKPSSIHKALHEMSYGFRARVQTFGSVDMNGYRFRSEKYEQGNVLTTRNTGIYVPALDAHGNATDYYGVIEDIIRITWEGSMQLDLVLFIAVGLIQLLALGELKTKGL